jgi:hypothetical protein
VAQPRIDPPALEEEEGDDEREGGSQPAVRGVERGIRGDGDGQQEAERLRGQAPHT